MPDVIIYLKEFCGILILSFSGLVTPYVTQTFQNFK